MPGGACQEIVQASLWEAGTPHFGRASARCGSTALPPATRKIVRHRDSGLRLLASGSIEQVEIAFDRIPQFVLRVTAIATVLAPLAADSWEGFEDPAQLNYRRYIALQHDREVYAEGVVDSFEALDRDADLDPAWADVLARVYLPARFAFHVLQITSLYVGQLGPSAAITNASFFQAADELRALQWIAYRAKSLSLTHGAPLADSAVARSIWEDDPAWQPAREVLERLLLAYDWGEAFTALNLAVKPALDAFFKESLAEAAQAHGDSLTAQLLRESGVDSVRSDAWTSALVTYAVAQRPDNRSVLDKMD